jgi:hypothetical protein
MHRVLVTTLVAACGGSATEPTATPKPASESTKLVVLFVVDQLPEWAFEAKRPALHGGFDRLLREGEWHVGQHPSAATLTAPGHALLGTGATTSATGILANEWWHRDLARSLKAVEAADGTISATWLRVPALGDAVEASHSGARAISVSLKDRAAILPIGHAGTPVWYDHKLVGFRSTAPVPWLDAYNREHPVAAHLHDVWNPLDAALVAKLSGVPDDRPGEVGIKGLGATFPHALADSQEPADTILASPLGNELVLDVASAAIDGEHLGTHTSPDLLVISLSAHDLIAHAWGHESWEAWDTLLRLDQRLDAFLTDLDRKIGAGRWVMIATSDHGAAPTPKGRVRYADVKKAANGAASAELGPGDWIADARYPSVYFTDGAIKSAGKDMQTVIRKVVFALRALPSMGRVERAADFEGHCETRKGDAFAICLALDPERSGEVFYMPAEGYVMEDDDAEVATAHGSLHAYDRLVPVIVLGPNRNPHAALAHPDGANIQMLQIAPMLSRWLGVTPPAEMKH